MKRALLVVICFLIMFLISDSSFANSPVEITAENIVEIDVTTQKLQAEGNVIVSFDDIRLFGDRLFWDLDGQVAYLEGNVIMEQGEGRYYGDSITYDLETEQASFDQVRTELSGENINGLIFVFGEQMLLDGDQYQIVQGKISTCDLTTPHYHIGVRSIEVYPNQKMVIRGVTYYEGKIPLFYWPYLVIPLDDRFDVDYFNLPEVGYSAKDGYYIKNRYNYYLTENAHGTIFYDYYTKHGVGLGFNHNYVHYLLGAGSLALYSIPARHRQFFNVQLDHEYSQEHLKLTTKNSYYREIVDQDLEINKSTQTSANYSRDGLTVTGSVNYAEREGSSESHNLTLAGSWNQRITPNLNFNVRSSLTDKNHTRVVNHRAETSYRINNHSLSLNFEQQFNPDILDPEATASWRSVNKLPEFTWQWRNPIFNGQSFPGRFELNIGRFLEYPNAITSFRAVPRLELTSRSWRSNFGTTITYSGGIAGYFYEENQVQTLAHTRINLQQSLTPNLRLTSSYNRQIVDGETPFRFDKQNPQNNLTGQLYYTNRPFTASIRTGYNFLTESYYNLISQISWNDYTTGLNLSATSYYNLNTQTFGNLVTMFNYRPSEQFIVRLGSRYQLNNQRFERVDGQLSLDLTESISLKYDVIYDFLKEEYTRGELTLLFDLHCRELSFSYNQVREEFRFKFSLNAFPKLPLGFSSSEGISLFELKDLQEILDLDE